MSCAIYVQLTEEERNVIERERGMHNSARAAIMEMIAHPWPPRLASSAALLGSVGDSIDQRLEIAGYGRGDGTVLWTRFMAFE